MSVKGKIFKLLAAYLMEKLQFDQVVSEDNPFPIPNLRWVDKQMGQFNHPELSQLVPLPAILIGFRKTNWQSESRRVQRGDSVLTFWVYFENYADSFQGSMNQDLALQFFEFNEAVHQALQGFDIPGLITALDRISDEDDEDQDMIIGTIFEYSTIISDDSADEHRHYVAVENTTSEGKYLHSIVRPPVDNGMGDEPDNQFVI